MNASSRKLVIYLAGLALVATLTSGCGALRKNLADNMGVKVKTMHVKVGDLGGSYKKLAGTRWDFFHKKQRKRQIRISYKHFGVKAIDDFNRQAAELYAQYRFAKAALHKSRLDVKRYLKKDIRRLSAKELNRAVKRNDKEQIRLVRRFKEVKNNLFLALRGTKEIVGKGQKMTGAGDRLVKSTPNQMAKDPAKAIYADEAVKEVYKSIKRIGKVIKGGPGLVSDLTSMTKVFGAVF